MPKRNLGSIFHLVWHLHAKVLQVSPSRTLRSEYVTALAIDIKVMAIKGGIVSTSFGYAHPRPTHMTAQHSIWNLANFPILAMRLSTHNLLGLRLADTVLALVIDPVALLGEMIVTLVCFNSKKPMFF